MADVIHGAMSGVNHHLRVPERLCLPCANWHADYRRAGRVLHGNSRTIAITTKALSRILAGELPVEVLAGELGPLTLDALRGGAGGRRG